MREQFVIIESESSDTNYYVEYMDGEKVIMMELPRRGGPFEALEKMFGGAEADLDLAMLKRVPELRRMLLRIATYRRVAVDKIAVLNPELDAFAQPVAGGER